MAEVNNKFEELVDLEPVLELCNDFYIGNYKIFNDKYIRKGSQESDEGYEARLVSTEYFAYFSTIIKEIVGLVTKKDPVLTGFEKFDLSDLDFDKNDLNSFVKKLTLHSLIDGLCFVSVKTNVPLNKVYLKIHKYIDLLSYKLVDGVLEQIVFREKVKVSEKPFELTIKERYTVFYKGGGEVWFDEGGGLKVQEKWTNSLEEIPVSFIQTGKEISKFVVIPPLYELARLNNTLLNLSSQIAGISNLISSPVAVFFGNITDRQDFKVGGKNALVFEDKTKEDFKYVTTGETGVKELTNRYNEILNSMDRTTFSILVKDTSMTVIDAMQNQTKNTAFLSNIAIEIESKINILFGYYAQLSNVNLKDDAYIEFQKDFSNVIASDAQLSLLYQLVLDNNLPRDTYLKKLKSLNILAKDFDIEAETSKLE